MDKDQKVLTIPEDLAKYAQIQPFSNTTPSQMVIDVRSPERKSDDLHGIQANTYSETIGINVEDPKIVTSIPELYTTRPSLTHLKIMSCIVLIMRHPKLDVKTLV